MLQIWQLQSMTNGLRRGCFILRLGVAMFVKLAEWMGDLYVATAARGVYVYVCLSASTSCLDTRELLGLNRQR